MLRQSLKDLLKGTDCIVTDLPEKWATKRPEQLTPEQFIELTIDIYGPVSLQNNDDSISGNNDDDGSNSSTNEHSFTSQKVWRAVRL